MCTLRIRELGDLKTRIVDTDREAYKQEVLSGSGLVLALFMDEGRGDRVIDYSGKGNHGTIYGARWVKLNGVWTLSFDGVDDYCDCGNDESLDITDAITIEAWVKQISAGDSSYPRITDKYPAPCMYIEGTRTLRWYGKIGGVSHDLRVASNALQSNVWQHLVLTYDKADGKVRGYVNGVLKGVVTTSGGELSTTTNLLLIGDSQVADRHFHGLISEVRIYNRALSADEIARHHQLGRPFHPA